MQNIVFLERDGIRMLDLVEMRELGTFMYVPSGRKFGMWPPKEYVCEIRFVAHTRM